MGVNLDKPKNWKADVAKSVDMYNDWFMKFAPKAFRETRIQTTKDVESALRSTDNLTNIKPALMREHPEVLPTLRMSTCPPLAVDRLIGLSRVAPNLVKSMELWATERTCLNLAGLKLLMGMWRRAWRALAIGA